MGTRGPIPKRTEDLKGHRSKDALGSVDKVEVYGEVTVPTPDPDWHPIATQLYLALSQSGQAKYYEPSDWAIAYSLMDDLSHFKESKARSGQMHSSIMTALTSLLVTEGDRRRLSLELTRKDAPDLKSNDSVTVMDVWKNRLSS